MARLIIYSTGSCPVCEQTQNLLKKRTISLDEIRLDQKPAALAEFSLNPKGARRVPQILIDGNWIGGFTELTEMHMEDQPDELMERA